MITQTSDLLAADEKCGIVGTAIVPNTTLSNAGRPDGPTEKYLKLGLELWPAKRKNIYQRRHPSVIFWLVLSCYVVMRSFWSFQSSYSCIWRLLLVNARCYNPTDQWWLQSMPQNQDSAPCVPQSQDVTTTASPLLGRNYHGLCHGPPRFNRLGHHWYCSNCQLTNTDGHLPMQQKWYQLARVGM